MSEPLVPKEMQPDSPDQVDPALDSPPVLQTAGSMLRAAREASGLHIAALAVSLKVPVKKLEALEGDRLDLLPDAVFVRALAASVCRSLKMDPAPVLAKLPSTAVPRLIQDANGINAPFRAPSDGPGPGWKDQLTRPVMLMVLALLLGALVLIFLPANLLSQSETSQGAHLSVPLPDLPQDKSALAAPTSGTAPATAANATAAISPTPALSVVTSTPTVVSPTLVISSKLSTIPVGDSAAATGAELVVFRTKSNSWVEVTDAKGQVALRRNMLPGESAGANGPPPLTVVVGRADATQVSVRGKPLDLAPHSRDNVARFEVK